MVTLESIDPYLKVILGIITAIAGGIAITKFVQGQKDRQIKVHVEKVKGNDHRIRQSRVRYMNKPIERCNVLFNGILLVWNSIEGKTEVTIFEDSQRNATISDDIFTEDAEIVIKSDKKTLKKTTFRKMELAP